MKQKKDLRISIFYVIAIGLSILLLPLLFTHNWFPVTFNKESAELGNYLAGITAPFLSFFGSVLVYFALVSQIKANEQIKDQFEKQNDDQLFFRLFDSLHDRIVNYTITNPHRSNSEIKGYEILGFLVKKFNEDMDAKCTYLGRHILAKEPGLVGENHYLNILHLDNKAYSLNDAIAFSNRLVNAGDYNKRWEFLKYHLGNVNAEDADQAKILHSIGSVYFYKIDFTERYDIYHQVYESIYGTYGSFFDGYFNNLKYLLNFIEESDERKFYLNFLRSNITSYEKAFIFYYIASNHSSRAFKDMVRKNELIEDLTDYNRFFIDFPSREEFQREIDCFYKSEQMLFN